MTSNTVKFVYENQIIEIQNPDSNETILNYVRTKLKKTGTKEGCAEGGCGACSVVLGELNNNGIIYKAVKVRDEDFLFRSNYKSPTSDPIGGSVWFPLMTSAANLGVANAARNYAINFAMNRKPTGASDPISKIPHVREQIGRMESKLIISKRA